MNEKVIRQYLQDNLTIKVDTTGNRVYVSLYLEGHMISSDSDIVVDLGDNYL